MKARIQAAGKIRTWAKRSMTGAEFRALRERLGVTQRELAVLLGLSQDSGQVLVSGYENGTLNIPRSRAQHLQMLVDQKEGRPRGATAAAGGKK